MIGWVASHILALPVWVALLVVFALPALEASAFVGFVFPGEIALILGGVLAFEGRLSLASVLAAGIAGAVVGDSAGYLVGRRYGRQVVDGTLGRFVNHKHFDRAERYLAERGGKAVFLGRFTAALRVMVPGLAGMSRMHYGKFAVFNVAGGAAWGSMCVLLGYLGGSSWRRVEHLASRVGLAALVLVVTVILVGYVARRSRSGWAQRLSRRLRGSRPAVRLVGRFPGQVAWVAARLDPAKRTGLLLTALVAVAVGAAWGFLGITQDVLAHEELALLDPKVHAWVLANRLSWLTQVMRVVTWFGANAVVVPVLAFVAVALSRARRSWAPALTVFAVYGWAVIAHAMVAELVHRGRPSAAGWLASASGWAYPSGHTIQATTACGLLVVLLGRGRSPRARSFLGAAAVLVVVLVAASRVYLGVHWLSDVLGSISLGVAILSIWGILRCTVFSPVADEPATDEGSETLGSRSFADS